jgi:glycosyltransferase involved in cell wall biosynthesis
MRILWVKAGKLLPVDTGGKIRSYNLLRHLAAHHELTLLSYYGGQSDTGYEEAIRAHFTGAVTVCTGVPDDGLAARLHYLRHVPSTAPYAVTKFTSPRVRTLIARWFNEHRFDVAVCDFLSASLNFPDRLSTPSVLFQHNVESVLWQRQATHESGRIKRAAFQLEARKMAGYEQRTVARFPQIIAVSDRDREAMAGMVDPSRITVVPTGVDVERYRAAASSRATQPVVMFLGSMDWEANIDAVEYFCRDMWPSIRQSIPDAMFRIVGRDPHPRVRLLASDSVQVTGNVPSPVDHLRDAMVFVVPLRIGGGTRLKIFEAMASGRAVVSTTIGAEGLDVHDGTDVLLADTPEAFAHAVVTVIKNDALRHSLEERATELAARHDWSAIGRRFERVLRQAAGTAADTADAPVEAIVGSRVEV